MVPNKHEQFRKKLKKIDKLDTRASPQSMAAQIGEVRIEIDGKGGVGWTEGSELTTVSGSQLSLGRFIRGSKRNEVLCFGLAASVLGLVGYFLGRRSWRVGVCCASTVVPFWLAWNMEVAPRSIPLLTTEGREAIEGVHMLLRKVMIKLDYSPKYPFLVNALLLRRFHVSYTIPRRPLPAPSPLTVQDFPPDWPSLEYTARHFLKYANASYGVVALSLLGLLPFGIISDEDAICHLCCIQPAHIVARGQGDEVRARHSGHVIYPRSCIFVSLLVCVR